MKILITGGAGFVGSTLAKLFKKDNPNNTVICLDNLKRRGSEVNLKDFKDLGIQFVHGDIRNIEDFEEAESDFDLFIEASAEPSVHAGVNSAPNYLINTNLVGTINCLEFARRHCEKFIFLSTSRVYSIKPLLNIPLQSNDTRLKVTPEQKDYPQGLSLNGISENFSTSTFRSLYGTTKLSSEYLIQEYVNNYGLRAIINRCGVLCGEGQWGKTDQGVFTLWVARHYFKSNLKYTGFGGRGHQVRDILHPEDLFELIKVQISQEIDIEDFTYNVGGGQKNSVSMLEYTEICQRITGNKIEIESVPETSPMDIPYYISDNTKAKNKFCWEPRINKEEIVKRVYEWLSENNELLKDKF